jgi:hypothetical protein
MICGQPICPYTFATASQLRRHVVRHGLGEGGLGECATEHDRFVLHAALAIEAEVVEQLGGAVVDILQDTNVLSYLRENGAPPGAFSHAKRSRVKRRARQYELNGDVVVRMMADGTRRIVPPVNSKVDLIPQTHAKTGHWGVRRTKGLLLSSYWWQGLEKDVGKVLAKCEVCSQVKATFNVADPQLHPLPVNGMMYRWGVDLCGPFSVSSRGNEFVMVCIEHFTKQVELMALPDKSAETTAYVFLSSVLGRYGSCAEVVTDQGSEFLGAFHNLLEECMIDQRTTSTNHPQADGLAGAACSQSKWRWPSVCWMLARCSSGMNSCIGSRWAIVPASRRPLGCPRTSCCMALSPAFPLRSRTATGSALPWCSTLLSTVSTPPCMC